jgi:F-type H+-transporting ATPase subunit b
MRTAQDLPQASDAAPVSHHLSLAAAAASVIDLDVSMFLQLGIFLVLFLLLRPLLFRRLVDLFAAREKSIEGAQQEARDMEEESRKKTVAYEDAMKKVRSEAGAERDALRVEAGKAANVIVSRARAQAATHLDDGRRAIHAEAEGLRGELASRARQMGLDLTRRLLGRDPGGSP